MTELLKTIQNAEYKEYESKDEFSRRFDQRTDSLSVEIPEITENKDAIRYGGNKIAEEFGLFPELLDDEPHSLYFIAIAQRYGNLEKSLENKEIDDITYESEKELIYNAMALVALKNSKHYDLYKELISSDEELDGEVEAGIINKYTNLESTAEVNLAIKNGLLDKTKEKLKITPENEEPYEIHVLNIGDKSVALSGMRPSLSDKLIDKQYNDPALDEYYKKVEEFEKYKDKMLRNLEDFKEEIKYSNVPAAWKAIINGVKYLNLPLPLVEKILHRNEKCLGRYDDIDYINQKAIIDHEYAHTQGGLLLDDDSLIGVSLEELRAEFYSGNKQGFGELIEMAIFILIMNGTDITLEMENNVMGGTVEGMFKYLANRIGLQRTLELGITVPNNYSNESSPLTQSIHDKLGGMNGLVERIYNDIVNSGGSEELNNRISQMSKVLLRSTNGSPEEYFSVLENINKMPFVAKKFREKIENTSK